MRLTHAMIAGITVLTLSANAYAVPGWAETSRDMLNVVPGMCRYWADQAIKQVTGGNAFTRQLSSNAYLSKGFTAQTGVFVYCMPTSEHFPCGSGQVPASTLTIVAFNNASAQQAAQVRDAVNSTIGNPPFGAWCF